MARILCLQLPSPPRMNVSRDYAGGYGTASTSRRKDYGHDTDKYPLMHPGLLTCAAILEKQHEVRYLDAQIERMNMEKVGEAVRRLHPDFILCVINLPSLDGDIEALNRIRKTYPCKGIVCFGTVCRIVPDRLLREAPIDVLLLGDAETQVESLFHALAEGQDIKAQPGLAYLDNDQTVTTGQHAAPMDMNSLPLPAYHLIPTEKYRYHELPDAHGLALLYTSKGCPFACSYYCPYPFGFGKKIHYRDPAKVVDDMDTLNKKFGIDTFLFRDQVFTIKRSHAEAICNGIIERELNIRWVCETKYDLVDAEMLRLMKRAGCHSIHYGLESGDENIFWKVGKPGGKSAEAAITRFGETIRATKEAGIIAHTHTIIGLPGESWETIRNTIKRLREWKVDSVQAAIITPYPGTALHEEAVRQGWLTDQSLSAFTGFDPVMELPSFSISDMKKAQKMLTNYWKDPFVTRSLRAMRKMLLHKNAEPGKDAKLTTTTDISDRPAST